MAPTGPLPDPLPATLEWAQTSADEGCFLGLTVRENDSGSLEALAFDPGARITAVAEGSPAAAAGMQIGDVLLSLGEIEVNDAGGLAGVLAGLEPGQVAQAQVQRGDSLFELGVTPRTRNGSASAAKRLWRADPARSLAGWLAGQGGVVLVTSHEDGPFPAAGVPVGSVILEVDGQTQRSDLDLIRYFQSQDEGERIEVSYREPDSTELSSARVQLANPERRVTELSLPVVMTYSSDPEGKQTNFVLLDFWFISLFRYTREGEEKHWSILRFLRFSTGLGELGT
jgi:S1-C subfamily serine protease